MFAKHVCVPQSSRISKCRQRRRNEKFVHERESSDLAKQQENETRKDEIVRHFNWIQWKFAWRFTLQLFQLVKSIECSKISPEQQFEAVLCSAALTVFRSCSLSGVSIAEHNFRLQVNFDLNLKRRLKLLQFLFTMIVRRLCIDRIWQRRRWKEKKTKKKIAVMRRRPILPRNNSQSSLSPPKHWMHEYTHLNLAFVCRCGCRSVSTLFFYFTFIRSLSFVVLVCLCVLCRSFVLFSVHFEILAFVFRFSILRFKCHFFFFAS